MTDDDTQADATESNRAMVTREQAALVQGATDDMPVLEAFQRFLDAERQRARRRMIAMAVSFSAALLLLIVAGVVYALNVLRPVHEEFTYLRTSIETSEKDRARKENRVSTALEKLQQEGRHLKESLSGERQSLAETRTELNIRSQNVESQLDATRKALAELKSENARLQDQLAEVRNGVPVLALEMESVLRKIQRQESQASVESARPPSGTHLAHATPPRPMASAPPVRSLSMVIFPGSKDDPITWRMPIPE
jgi:hypothetical protein